MTLGSHGRYSMAMAVVVVMMMMMMMMMMEATVVSIPFFIISA